MKRINSFAIVFIIFIFFLIGAKMNNNSRIYTRRDLKIELSASYVKESVVSKMKFVNLSSDTIKIPTLIFPSDERDFFGDWFEITDNNGNFVDYKGIQADIEYDSENMDCLVIKPNQTYTLTFSSLTKYYNLLKGETYSISYLGPLGESNIINLKIK